MAMSEASLQGQISLETEELQSNRGEQQKSRIQEDPAKFVGSAR
jgi:hypothetical protein